MHGRYQEKRLLLTLLHKTAITNFTKEHKKKMAAKFYDLTAKLLTGETFNFSSLQGKVVLIENVMNELHQRYADKGLVILGVPCNQFGHQNEEILLSLKYVRPGNGFEPKFQLLEKVDVNGKNADPLFVFLRESLPFPSDDPSALISDPKLIIWSPVCRNDVAWNFEKFLIGPDGVPFKRYRILQDAQPSYSFHLHQPLNTSSHCFPSIVSVDGADISTPPVLSCT
uniref:Glutathione peroxidase 1 n=1 Tax=Amphiprion ocellaris TaxID=80972 RepID=A0A3Q1BH79_AMPOC